MLASQSAQTKALRGTYFPEHLVIFFPLNITDDNDTYENYSSFSRS
jgi:hypothetical protein